MGPVARTTIALIAHLPPVAVRAVDDAAAPLLGHAGDVGQLVDQTGGHEHPSRRSDGPVGEGDAERAAGSPAIVGDGAVDDLDPVAPHLARGRCAGSSRGGRPSWPR